MDEPLVCTNGIDSYHPFFKKNSYYWILIFSLAQEIVKYLPDARIDVSLKNDCILVATITTQKAVEIAIHAFNQFIAEWGDEHLHFANFVVVLEYGQLRIIRECNLRPLMNFYKFR